MDYQRNIKILTQPYLQDYLNMRLVGLHNN